MLFSPFGLPRLWRHTSVSVASSEHVVIICIHFNSMKYWQSWSGRNRNYGNRKWTLVGSHTLLLVLPKETGFWRSISCNHNCQCPLPLHKQVSSEQGCDCLRRSLIYYQISIYIIYQYIYTYTNAICVKFLLWYCLLQPFLDFSWHKWPLLMSHFTSLAFNLDPWAPDKHAMAVHFCANIHLNIHFGHLCKQHLSCWIRIC